MDLNKTIAIYDGSSVVTGTLRTLFPNVSFSKNGPNNEWLAAHNVFDIQSKSFTGKQKNTFVTPYHENGVIYNNIISDKSVDERKVEMYALTTARFKVKRDAGTTITIGQTVVPVSTMHDAVVELNEAAVEITANGGPMKVVTRSKKVVSLTVNLIDTMMDAIRAYVRLCQERESALYEAIEAAQTHSDLDNINVEAGSINGEGLWP